MRSIAIVVVVCATAGCPPTKEYPSSIGVRGYVAPADQSTFVLFYHPWGPETTAGASSKTGIQVLSPLDQLAIECANVACKWSGSHVTFDKPPTSVDQIELVVNRPGYQTARIQVPRRGSAYPTVLVLMKGTGS